MGVLCSVLGTAHAAPVTWTGPTPIVNETSISLNGRLVHAGTWGTGTGAGPLSVPVGSETIVFENAITGTALGFSNAVATGGEYQDAAVFVPTGAINANFELVMDGMAPDGVNPKVVTVGHSPPVTTRASIP